MPARINGSNVTIDISDIKSATATSFTVVTEVQLPAFPWTPATRQRGAAGGDTRECVQWGVATTATTWSITRRVGAYYPRTNVAGYAPAGICDMGTAALNPAQVVIPPQQIASGFTPSSVFSYRLVCDSSLCSGVTTCQGGTVTQAPSASARLWIASILVDLRALTTDDSTAKNASYRSEVAIRARGSDDYAYAVGCSDRFS
jgi:hypothetical protein